MNKVLKKRRNHFMDGSKRMKSYRVIKETAEFHTHLARKPSTRIIRLVHLSLVQSVDVGTSLTVVGMHRDPVGIV